jgi:ankyrin repeat protein
MWGKTACMKLLLQAGASPHAVNTALQQPLHLAVINNHTSAIRALLSSTPDPFCKEEHGLTPLQSAREYGEGRALCASVSTVHHYSDTTIVLLYDQHNV